MKGTQQPMAETPEAADSNGDQDALVQVYDELRALAAGFLRRERPDHTLQPTALVNEALSRLAPHTPGSFKGIIFLASPEMLTKNQRVNFGEQLSVLANCWKDRFGSEDPHFFYTMPSKELAAKITSKPGLQCPPTVSVVLSG